jgi:drug/metabolite transporter (DMT)-like permease
VRVRPAARPGLRANAGAALAAVLFGASVVAVRVAVQQIPPLSLAVLRFGQAAVVLVAAALVCAPRLLRVERRSLPLLVVLGAVLFTLFPVTFNAGLRWTEASRGALMLATMPLWSVWLARRGAGERLAGRQLAGVVVSLLGIALAFVEPGALHGGARALAGDGLLLLTALLGAVYGVLAKRALARERPVTVTAYAMGFGTVLLVPAAVVEGLGGALGRLDGRLLALVVFVGVPGGALAFWLWTAALSRLTPTQVAVYVNLNPVVAALLGLWLLGERRSAAFALGFAAVVAGVGLVNWPRGKRGPIMQNSEEVARRLAEDARPELGAEGFSDERIDELAHAFVNDHVGEGRAQFVNWALVEGPCGLDPEAGF